MRENTERAYTGRRSTVHKGTANAIAMQESLILARGSNGSSISRSDSLLGVVVTDNLFGDIITDLEAGVQGGLEVATSANLNLNGSAPSMFEAIHGSAPDIAGKGWANPSGAILSPALILGQLGESAAANLVFQTSPHELS